MSAIESNPSWHDFDVAVARWSLGDLPAEQLPRAAMEALVAGCETDSLPVLAGLETAGWSEIEPTVVHVLSERGKTIPTQNIALSRVANDVIRRMVSGEMDAETALRRLSALSTRALDAPLWEHLGTFHHLQLDWDVADKVGFDRAALVEEARRTGAAILSRGGLPFG